MNPIDTIELVIRLKSADCQDRELFRELFSQACNLLDLKDEDIANRFGASRSTPERWRNGIATPHPAIRKVVYDWLLTKCQDTKP